MTKDQLRVALQDVIEPLSSDAEALHEHMLSGVTYERLVPIATGGKILTYKDVGEGYQGDYLFLVQRGDEYARIVTGYGTCSGCDMILGCESWDDLLNFVHEIRDGAIWHSKHGMIEDLNMHDVEGSWYGSEMGKWQSFKAKALALLEAA